MINRRQLADTRTADRKEENSSPLPSCQRHEDEFGVLEMCGPLCIAHTTPNEKTTRKPQAIGRFNMKCVKALGNWMFQYEICESLRQFDETKRKCPFASGNWTKQNENAHLPQAIEQNKMKTPICFRQLDETKRKHPFALGNWTKQNENTHLPQAIGRNKTKTSICLRQLDAYKKKEHKDSGYRLHRTPAPSNRRLRGCSNFWRQETFRLRRNHSFGCESMYSEGVMPNVSLKHLEK